MLSPEEDFGKNKLQSSVVQRILRSFPKEKETKCQQIDSYHES